MGDLVFYSSPEHVTIYIGTRHVALPSALPAPQPPPDVCCAGEPLKAPNVLCFFWLHICLLPAGGGQVVSHGSDPVSIQPYNYRPVQVQHSHRCFCCCCYGCLYSQEKGSVVCVCARVLVRVCVCVCVRVCASPLPASPVVAANHPRLSAATCAYGALPMLGCA